MKIRVFEYLTDNESFILKYSHTRILEKMQRHSTGYEIEFSIDFQVIMIVEKQEKIFKQKVLQIKNFLFYICRSKIQSVASGFGQRQLNNLNPQPLNNKL